MDKSKRKYIESELVYKVIGCAMTVLNELGHGLREKTYERALCYELGRQKIKWTNQNVHKVYYKGKQIDSYIPDIEIKDRLIIELKTVNKIYNQHLGQILNYLKITGIQAGVIINFAHPKLEWKKVVLTQNQPDKLK